MRILAKRLWREAKKQAEIHLANVSIWRKQMRIDNNQIVPESGAFLNEIEEKKDAKTLYFSIIYGWFCSGIAGFWLVHRSVESDARFGHGFVFEHAFDCGENDLEFRAVALLHIFDF